MSVQPKVTISRVESWLKYKEVVYEATDADSVLVDFASCVIGVAVQDSGFLTVSSIWRGEFHPSAEPSLAAYVDKCNYEMIAPRAFWVTSGDGVLRLQADMWLLVSEGMSDAQLDSGLESAFTSLLSFCAAAAKDFPALVTWN